MLAMPRLVDVEGGIDGWVCRNAVLRDVLTADCMQDELSTTVMVVADNVLGVSHGSLRTVAIAPFR
jgi:hypothetical protein